MKILVVSLLRLGDLIQQRVLLNQIKAMYPNAEVHVLINKQFETSVDLFKNSVNQFHYFDRDRYQRGIGEASYNILWSYSLLKKLINDLNNENFDLIFNFTHNVLSGYLIGLIHSGEKKGLFYEQGKFRGIDNPWLQYFNERFSGENKSVFHYLELLSKAFSIPIEMNTLAPYERPSGHLILFQCLTSDYKKNWSLSKFASLKDLLERWDSRLDVKILAATPERERLLAAFDEKDILFCDLNEAQQLLGKAQLLVSLDTSIKHLAAQVGTPIVEICIVSSDARKTGAFTDKVIKVQTNVSCAPCSHSRPCNQELHRCNEELTTAEVFQAAKDILERRSYQGRTLLDELDKLIWTVYLNRDTSSQIEYNEHEIRSLIKTFGSGKIYELLPLWLESGTTFETWLVELKKALPERSYFRMESKIEAHDISALLICAKEILASKKDVAGFFVAFIESLTMPFRDSIQFVDRLYAAIDEVENLILIRTRLATLLKTLSQEGDFYAKGIERLSFIGVEEAREGMLGNFEDRDL